MAVGLADAIRAVVQDRGITEDLLTKVIEEFLLAAYKRKFGHSDNAVVQFTEDGAEVTLYAQKRIVEEVEDPVTEIPLDRALDYSEEAEIGDELLIEIDPKEFDRGAIQTAKQKAKQRIREIQKDTLYSEFIEKVGELVIGYVQRERNGNLFVDLGKAEGILPKRYQSPRESYRANDRIKALIVDVQKGPNGLSIALSRTHTELVKRIFELEVPEIYARTVEIVRIVREAGYRTKIAVASNRDDVDPVGACVGMRGVRIQAIVRELEGEKIDILKFDPDPRVLIKNALSPADVTSVVILDEATRHALAIVPEDQLSLAIGKQGLNVRLANRLADWSIDVKTMEQFDEMDLVAESKRAVSELFSAPISPEDEISSIADLPGIPGRVVTVLGRHGYTLIEELVTLAEESLRALDGLSNDDVDKLMEILNENVEIVEQEEDFEEEDEDDDYEGEEPIESDGTPVDDGEEFEEEVITAIEDLPGITDRIIERLSDAGITDLETLVGVDPDTVQNIAGLTAAEIETVRMILTEFVEIVEDDDEEAVDEDA